MTDDGRPADGDDRIPTDDHVLWLARLHADLLDDEPGRAAVERADTEIGTVFAALDQVRADLADTPEPGPPPDLLPRIDRALAAERAPEPPALEPHSRPSTGLARPGGTHGRRERAHTVSSSRPTSGRVLVAVLLAVVVVGLAGAGLSLYRAGETAPPSPTVAAPRAGEPPDADLPVVDRDDLPSALRQGLRGGPAGPLADPERLAGCLAAHGVAPGVAPIGTRRVLVDGSPRVVLVLPTGVAARFRVLVVGEGCSAGAPLTVADSVVGR